MSLYEYSNSVNDFQSLIGSVPENVQDMKDKIKGELFLSLGVPGGYMMAKKFGAAGLKSLKGRFSGDAADQGAQEGAGEPAVDEGAVEGAPGEVMNPTFEAGIGAEADEYAIDFTQATPFETTGSGLALPDVWGGTGLAIRGQVFTEAGEQFGEAQGRNIAQAYQQAQGATAEGTEAATAETATAATAGETATAAATGAVEGVLAAGGELTEETTATLGPEVGAIVGVGTLVAAGVMGIIDMFKHHHENEVVANLPQLGV